MKPVLEEEGELFTLQMGPQHPATHGVLKLDLELDGRDRCPMPSGSGLSPPRTWKNSRKIWP